MTRVSSKGLPVSVSIALMRTPPGERERVERAVSAQLSRLGAAHARKQARIDNLDTAIEALGGFGDAVLIKKQEQLMRELAVLNDTLRELRAFAREHAGAENG